MLTKASQAASESFETPTSKWKHSSTRPINQSHSSVFKIDQNRVPLHKGYCFHKIYLTSALLYEFLKIAHTYMNLTIITLMKPVLVL